MDDKKVIFSGIQPSSQALTLGNYIGAVNNWLKFQDEYNCIYSVVDLHSITVRQNPSELRARSLSFLAQYIACGLDPNKNIMFYQSHVPQHAELAWVLNCITYVGELSRMTQFKDKSRKHADNINMGLMDYPVLMAADILLYKTSLVPIGTDQKQHVEMARNIAMRFNNVYGDTFIVPEPFMAKSGAKIYSLQAPTQKMSKSDENENAVVYITDEPDAIMRKFKRAVTDSDNRIVYDEVNKPGISNLINIYAVMTGKTVRETEIEFEGKGYGEFKIKTGEAVVERLADFREKYKRITSDKTYVEQVAKEGANKARCLASKTLDKVYRKVGFVQMSI